MEIIEVVTNKQKKQYINFIYDVYKNDSKYKDMNLMFVKNFLYQQDSYSKRCIIKPLIIVEDSIRVVGMYVYTRDSKELKLSFLEFMPNSDKYLKEIIRYGEELAKRENLTKIIIGINGHISYGLGILKNDDYDFEFNGNYNPGYYIEELDKLNLITKKAFSYKYSTGNNFHQEILDNVYENYQFRTINKKHFKQEMLIFGDLCDKSLSSTPYYSKKTNKEMYELIKEMKPLLQNEDIIFAMKDNKEIGFIFTHPDYAEFFNSKKVNKIAVFLKSKIKRTSRIIYNVIGILPEYQNKAIALGLVHQTALIRENKYSQAVSSFVLEENTLSTKMCTIFSLGINREYNLYEIEV